MTNTLLIPPLRDLPTGHLEARKQHLLAEIGREPGRPRLTKHFPVSLPLERRRWQVAAIALAAAAALAITLTVLLPGNGDGLSSAGRYIHPLPRTKTSEQGGPRLVAAVLLRAAHKAANQPETAPGPGQFVYTKSESVYEEVAAGRDRPLGIAFRPSTREIWIAPDGSGRIRE